MITDSLLARIAEDLANSWVESGLRAEAFATTRAFRECEAKRQIVDAHRYSEDGGHCCASDDPLGEEMFWNEPCPTLAALAAIYVDDAGVMPTD